MRVPIARRPPRDHPVGGDRSERGAVLVELALVSGLLLVLLFGIIEYGMGWRGAMTTVSAARSSARTASSLARDPSADLLAMSSLRSNLESNGLLDGVQRVVIYRASRADGSVPPRCSAGTPTAADACTVLSGAELRDLDPARVDTYTGCLTTTPGAWCPVHRVTDQARADHLGVWVRLTAPSLTHFFGRDGFTIERYAVMRLEPS